NGIEVNFTSYSHEHSMANFYPPPNTHAYRLYLVKDHKQKSFNFQAPLQSAKPCILAQRFAACPKKLKKIF
ncbi:hypothetical protein ACFO3A_14800, partial [Comamonas nitrativorans]